MKIYVARHGQTQMNADNQVCGRTDIPLTQLGLQQAQQLADRYNLPVIVDDRLIEQNFGIYEGVDRKDPRFLAGKRQLAARHPGGESMLQMAQRVYNLLDDVKEKYPDKNILLVCHGGVCRIIRTYFEDLDTETFASYSPDNASLVEYEL